MTKKLKAFAASLAVGTLTIGILDFVAYWLVPESLVSFAPEYRSEPLVDTQKSAPPRLRGYPPGYFRADDSLGFDIRENVNAKMHIFRDASVEIFSNQVGCFDKHTLDDIRRAAFFDYFAGDSFTWGYAEWPAKFATVYEKQSLRFTVKCGVTNTGQLHQFEKFRRVVNAIGMHPQRVFVGYSPNDPTNDFAHPHTTVIDDFLVDTVELNSRWELTRRDMDDVRTAISDWLKHEREIAISGPTSSFPDAAKSMLKRYSLSSNLLNLAKNRLYDLITGLHRVTVGKAGVRKNFYMLDSLILFDTSYTSNKYTLKNRNAILRWAKDADANNYELVFILIPRKEDFNNTEYFSGLTEFLKTFGIQYVDLTNHFKQSGKTFDYFYWRHDGHLNNDGNKFVGEMLARQFK